MLNRTGVLDVVISDDVDSFLFGALAVRTQEVYKGQQQS